MLSFRFFFAKDLPIEPKPFLTAETGEFAEVFIFFALGKSFSFLSFLGVPVLLSLLLTIPESEGNRVGNVKGEVKDEVANESAVEETLSC